ncbi:GNAT family N-acetyltransferase [uncultured Vibrio sp.]|uniref:GNAT family N-acetyltransferase n=1 Tax=uncultured Vibrio sp. TaxID=114054 RepID=UPI000917C261|nr:GNAT family N-acetyltransferase [uncultured Vibrio sp.]OIQ26403.1 MAG: GNAT family N-acetyltransferase [Vibrio sp. MedPE-SWchi]
MDIKVDNLENGGVIGLLEEHLADMYATSPAESVHALDVDALKATDITFFSGWKDSLLMGCVAIKVLDEEHVELKSMRTSTHARQSGVASQLLEHALKQATQLGYTRVSLETGTEEYFRPARNLYEKFGFQYCGPFSNYTLDPHSQFMTLAL